ncbi:MAG: GGDEF domain-containing protein [Acholeplasmatales bacterium]
MLNMLKNRENKNNLYIIRNRHKKVIFVSSIKFNDMIYTIENINEFYQSLYDIDRVLYDIEPILNDAIEVNHQRYYFTSRHLLPVDINIMVFNINRSKYYLEHYELVEDLDPLTNLPTRASLELTFKDYAFQNLKFDLIFIDIDSFEKYNTKIGYIKTDFILQRITSLMKSYFHPNKVFRYGGDEFIIVSLEKATDEYIEGFKKEIRKIKMLENFDLSYGISTFPIMIKLEDLVHAASEAMKEQKASKKNKK